MKKILVTGSSGFIGRSVVRLLAERDMQPVLMDLPEDDVTSPGSFGKFASGGIDHLIHLAGRTFVPDSWKDPQAFYSINLMGTVNALEFCRKTGAGMTYVSSYLYGAPEYLPVDEAHPVKSYNPYSHSKLIADSTCSFYARNFGMKVSILRPFNAYGPGQPGNFLIPEIIRMVTDTSAGFVEVMDLRPKRDYVFVEDLADAIFRTVEGKPGIYNVGSGLSYSVEQIIQTVMRLSGIEKPYRARGSERQNEIFDLDSSTGLIRESLGWQAMTSMEEGLEACLSRPKP